MNGHTQSKTEYIPCADCGAMGYTDQRTFTLTGFICARCANPHIDWSQYEVKQ